MRKSWFVILVCGCLGATTARAAAPVALVEDVSAKSAGVELMDYVEPGKVIKLGASDTLTLSYLKSCWRETIRGGSVTVGAEQSTVEGGNVRRDKVACDGGKMELAAAQSKQSAAMVFRGAPPKPQFTIFARAPVVELPGGGTLVIDRVDVAGEKHEIAIAATGLVHAAFVDLSKDGIRLEPGGIYRAKVGKQQVVFKVDPKATDSGPIAGRLVRFQPAG